MAAGNHRLKMSFQFKKLAISIIFVSVLIYLSLGLSGNLRSSREKLTDTPDGVNHVFRPNREPTVEERKAGMDGLNKWKSASRRERNSLADDIVLSKVLLGLTQNEIIAYMGKPDGFSTSNDIGPEIRLTGYSAQDGESQCDLRIELNEKGKATDVYLDVND